MKWPARIVSVPAILAFAILIPSAGKASGELRFLGSESTTQDWGNTIKNRSVGQSTTTVVIISSAPANSGNVISDWRCRVIENASNTALVLYGNNTSFTIYQSSAGIHISSDTTNQLNRYVDFSGSTIYGIWAATGTLSGGASVTEHYYKK